MASIEIVLKEIYFSVAIFFSYSIYREFKDLAMDGVVGTIPGMTNYERFNDRGGQMPQQRV